MTKSTTQINQQTSLPSTSRSVVGIKAKLLQTFLLLIFLTISFFVGSYYSSTQQNNVIQGGSKSSGLSETPDLSKPSGSAKTPSSAQLSATNSPYFATIPESKTQGFPMVLDGKLVILPLEPNQPLIVTQASNLSWGSGALGKGSSDPISSPDNQKIAYISNDEELHVLTADGKSDTLIPSMKNVEYISGWSPDSNRLIVFVRGETIANQFFPEGPMQDYMIPKTATVDLIGQARGFYLVDLQSRNVRYLSELAENNFNAWVDPNEILLDLGRSNSSEYVTYNLDTHFADRHSFEESIDQDFATQFDFSADGKKWVLDWSGGTSDAALSQIIYADFPSIDGQVLIDGEFAQYQGARISLDGKKIIFMGRDEVNGPRFVYLFDGKSTKRMFGGIPTRWITNHSFLYRVSDPVDSTNPRHATKVVTYDLNTGSSTILYEEASN